MPGTHIHAIPPGYKNALVEAGGDPSGFHTPDWSEEGTLQSLDLTGSARAVLSVSTPGIPIAGTGQQARDLCRETNDHLADLVNKHPLRLDFFGALPDWRDVNGTLEEIDYIYSTQKQLSVWDSTPRMVISCLATPCSSQSGTNWKATAPWPSMPFL